MPLSPRATGLPSPCHRCPRASGVPSLCHVPHPRPPVTSVSHPRAVLVSPGATRLLSLCHRRPPCHWGPFVTPVSHPCPVPMSPHVTAVPSLGRAGVPPCHQPPVPVPLGSPVPRGSRPVPCPCPPVPPVPRPRATQRVVSVSPCVLPVPVPPPSPCPPVSTASPLIPVSPRVPRVPPVPGSPPSSPSPLSPPPSPCPPPVPPRPRWPSGTGADPARPREAAPGRRFLRKPPTRCRRRRCHRCHRCHRAMPLLRRPPKEEEEEDGDPFASHPESRYRRRATLERLVGLAPFGRARRGPAKDGDGDGGRARRRSEDFGLLRRLPGRRKASVEALAERTVPKRGSLLRLALGTRGQRGSGGERLAAEGEGGSDGEQDGGGQRPEGRGKGREPLSVLEILELIQRRELVAADEQIIALEAECVAAATSSSPSPSPVAGRQTRDVALLYEALLAQLWAVVAEAVPAGRPYPPLRSVIRVLEQEEAADGRHPPGTPGRPRALRRRWQEAVGRAASERLGQVAPVAGLGARLAALAGRLVGDLGAVRCHVAPAYPPEYGAFGVYARGYHRALAQQLATLAQRALPVPDLYLLLDWHSNTYPREVLGHPEVGALLQAQALGPLLPPETQRGLERSCIAAVKAKVEVAVAQELQLSEDTWAEEATSQELQEGLATRVTGLLRAHVDRAPQITPEFGMEMAHSLLGVLVAFLHSFQRKVERFLEAPAEASPPDGATGWAIALVNCCPPFRAFAERLAQFGHPESEEPRRQAHTALDKVTRLCNHVLTQRLFEDLKPYFNKLMKRKWLTSSDAFDTIVMLITSFTQKLRPLRPEPYQVLVSEVHRRVLIEYVRPLMQVRLVCTSAKMRARVAARLGDEARQLRELFSRLDSASPWLDSVVPRLRELLVLEDTAALQMEVGVLVRDFPDVRREHVAAMLDVRGLRGQAARQEILGVLQDVEPGPPRHRAFFAQLPVARQVRCLPFHWPRLARLARPRLPRPHPPRP